MTDREKLIELLHADVCEGKECPECPYSKNDDLCMAILARKMADYMIANGVTVRQLDGCQYCKEGRDGYRTMFGAFSVDNPFHGSEWTIKTGHCKPRQIYFCPMCGRKLSEPPKEVAE